MSRWFDFGWPLDKIVCIWGHCEVKIHTISLNFQSVSSKYCKRHMGTETHWFHFSLCIGSLSVSAHCFTKWVVTKTRGKDREKTLRIHFIKWKEKKKILFNDEVLLDYFCISGETTSLPSVSPCKSILISC